MAPVVAPPRRASPFLRRLPGPSSHTTLTVRANQPIAVLPFELLLHYGTA